MNPVISSSVGVVIRALLIAAGAQGIFSDDQLGQIVSALTIVASVAWSFYEKYRSRQKLVTALASGPTTERAVEFTIQTGGAASVMTPKDQTPQ